MPKPQFPEILPHDASPPDRDIPEIPFTAVQRRRNRRDGWTEERQRAFIAALARCGSVSAAARSVGLQARGAYRLLDLPGAEEFARAWDTAADIGIEVLRCDALERALYGSWVPVYRRGKLVRVEHRKSDRLAIAMLGGRPVEVAENHQRALTRLEHRRDQRELDAAKAERDRKVEQAEEEFHQECNRLVERIWHGPRVRML